MFKAIRYLIFSLFLQVSTLSVAQISSKTTRNNYSEIGSYYAQLIGSELNQLTANKYYFHHLTDKKIGGSAPPSFFFSSFGGTCKTTINDNYEAYMYAQLDKLTRSEINLCMVKLFSNPTNLNKLKDCQSRNGFQGFEFVFSYQFPNKLVNLSYFIIIDDIIARDFDVKS